MVGGVFIPNFPIIWQEVYMKPHVIIYSRPGCHLCDEAKAAIRSAGIDDQFTFEEINIESDNELLRKYKYDIPVIAINGAETFIHRLTPQEFRQKLLATKRHKRHK
jgi:glutaredoxin